MWEAIKGDQKSETELTSLRSRVQCGFSSSDNYPRVSTDDFCWIDLRCWESSVLSRTPVQSNVLMLKLSSASSSTATSHDRTTQGVNLERQVGLQSVDFAHVTDYCVKMKRYLSPLIPPILSTGNKMSIFPGVAGNIIFEKRAIYLKSLENVSVFQNRSHDVVAALTH